LAPWRNEEAAEQLRGILAAGFFPDLVDDVRFVANESVAGLIDPLLAAIGRRRERGELAGRDQAMDHWATLSAEERQAQADEIDTLLAAGVRLDEPAPQTASSWQLLRGDDMLDDKDDD
jgi:hypothetical protein